MKLVAFILSVCFCAVSYSGSAQEVVYMNVSEYLKSMEIEVITPKNEHELTLVEATADNQVKITNPNKTTKFLKDNTMGHSVVIKMELEKWIKQGFDIQTSHIVFGKPEEGTYVKHTVYVLVKD